MVKIIKELKKIMEERHVSMETISRHIGCSAKTVRRWLLNENPPNLTSQRMIQEGLESIRESYPVTNYELAMKARLLYKKIKRQISYPEKVELFGINQTEGVEAYIQKLEELVKKYAPDKNEVMK